MSFYPGGLHERQPRSEGITMLVAEVDTVAQVRCKAVYHAFLMKFQFTDTKWPSYHYRQGAIVQLIGYLLQRVHAPCLLHVQSVPQISNRHSW